MNRTRDTERGIVMIDVMMGAAVLGIAILGTIAVIPTVGRMQGGLKEREEAHIALLAVCERLQALGATESFRIFNAAPEDDPDGPGTAIGDVFAVGDLIPVNNDGFVGRVKFPVHSVDKNGKAKIDEKKENPSAILGMPRDLDGNGKLDGDVKLEEILMMPVQVEIDWKGVAGEQHLEAVVLLPR